MTECQDSNVQLFATYFKNTDYIKLIFFVHVSLTIGIIHTFGLLKLMNFSGDLLLTTVSPGVSPVLG